MAYDWYKVLGVEALCARGAACATAIAQAVWVSTLGAASKATDGIEYTDSCPPHVDALTDVVLGRLLSCRRASVLVSCASGLRPSLHVRESMPTEDATTLWSRLARIVVVGKTWRRVEVPGTAQSVLRLVQC